jgi:hypothetical protein
MKHILSFSLLVALSLPARAQQPITGFILRADKTPVEFMNVVLYTAADTGMVKAAASASDGQFVLDEVAPGDYFIECVFTGFDRTRTPAFSHSSEKPTPLGTITVSETPGISKR